MTNWYVHEQAAFADHAERIDQAERRRLLRGAPTRRQRSAWWTALRARWRHWVQRRAVDHAGAR